MLVLPAPGRTQRGSLTPQAAACWSLRHEGHDDSEHPSRSQAKGGQCRGGGIDGLEARRGLCIAVQAGVLGAVCLFVGVPQADGAAAEARDPDSDGLIALIGVDVVRVVGGAGVRVVVRVLACKGSEKGSPVVRKKGYGYLPQSKQGARQLKSRQQ